MLRAIVTCTGQTITFENWICHLSPHQSDHYVWACSQSVLIPISGCSHSALNICFCFVLCLILMNVGLLKTNNVNSITLHFVTILISFCFGFCFIILIVLLLILFWFRADSVLIPHSPPLKSLASWRNQLQYYRRMSANTPHDMPCGHNFWPFCVVNSVRKEGREREEEEEEECGMRTESERNQSKTRSRTIKIMRSRNQSRKMMTKWRVIELTLFVLSEKNSKSSNLWHYEGAESLIQRVGIHDQKDNLNEALHRDW